MFAPPLRTRLALLVAYVVAVSAAPPKGSFAIVSPPGSHQTLSGSVNYDPVHAANMDETGAFAVLAPRESISVTHNLPVTYSFAQSEAGDETIEPENPFTYVGADDTPKDLRATVEGIANVKLSRNLVVSRHVHDKRMSGRPKSKSKSTGPQGVSSGSSSAPRFRNCAPYDRIIGQAARDAWQLLTRAIADIQRVPHEYEDLGDYEMWFGRYAESRRRAIQDNLGRMVDRLSFPGFTIDCNCNEAIPFDLIAGQRLIRICTPFWSLIGDGQAAQLLRIAGRLVPTLGVHSINLYAAHDQAMADPVLASVNVESYVGYALNSFNPTLPPISPDSVESPPSYNS